MKSTIKVSISSVAFNLEDDAYQLLKSYLDSLNAHFSKNDGGKEIIEDIEARLAELLLTKINTPDQAVTANQINEIIGILGKPEELNDDSATGSKPENPPYPPSVSAKKRLYRDPDNQVVSGVCGGLGVYFNIDPVIFRILFVVVTLSGSFFWFMNLSAIAVIAYVVLWISLPKALTMAQKLEMRGESPSVANIERKLREEAIKSPATAKPQRSILARLVRIGFYILAAIVAIPVICVGIALIVSFVVIVFAGGWFLHDSIFPIMDFVALSEASLTTIKILVLIVVVIPLILLVYAAIRLLFRFKTKSKISVISLATIWVLCIFGLVGVSGYSLKNYWNGTRIIDKETLTTASDTLYVAIPSDFSESNNRLYIGWSSDDNHSYIPYLWISEEENVMSVFPKIDVYHVDDSTFNISYTRSVRARNKALAKQKIETVPVQYSVTDSLITITPHQFTKEHKWSGESGRLTIYVPKGKEIVLSEDLDRDKYHHFNWEYDEFD